LYPGDIDLESKTIRHGVWVHPWRSGYQARDVDQIVEAYHYGLVFNEEDIRRIIRTNLEVMWNGDRENPVFISSNGLGAEEDTVGLAAFKRTYGHSNATKNSGELWTALLDFDQTIRDLYELRFRDKNSRRYLRYRETVLADPPGFSRKYAGEDVTVPELQFTESRELNLAAVLPHILEEGKAIIVCQSWDPGELSIDLLTLANEPVLNLYRGSIEEGVFMITWDGAGPAGGSRLQGRFKVRWSIGTGYREFPIEIR